VATNELVRASGHPPPRPPLGRIVERLALGVLGLACVLQSRPKVRFERVVDYIGNYRTHAEVVPRGPNYDPANSPVSGSVSSVGLAVPLAFDVQSYGSESSHVIHGRR
jgi:hypothetical protein